LLKTPRFEGDVRETRIGLEIIFFFLLKSGVPQKTFGCYNARKRLNIFFLKRKKRKKISSPRDSENVRFAHGYLSQRKR